MGKDVVYAVIAIIGIVVGALAFTYHPGVEVRTKTEVITTTVTESPVTTTRQPITVTGTTPIGQQPAPSIKISYNEQLAQKGVQLFKELACNACHTVKGAGIEVGGNIGPDLSKTLLGNVGVEKGTAGGPIMSKYFEKNGLTNPAANLDKAAQLVAKFLTEGDKDLAPTMFTQTEAFKKTYGDKWATEYVPALVEMFKMALARSQS
ncbi:c-type cytochrome [Pyrobaculum aerophilum]|uniref:Cytochrome C n=1 Tax=Pyrobaculum aerophilum TaxID=13773 RepID=A0A371R2W8_9CREN|nr:c-type cytochrome [Pyrobaculum aerophilum]RFA95442.1 cytochrome C [Pyrobaculum aerophilum]RFA98091.1 cytochrome C [Pyrobaculum aerophilum]